MDPTRSKPLKDAPRLLCDEMLAGLGKWLRAAGYDTLIAEPGSADHALLQRAQEEQRLLITRDRHLAARRDARRQVVLLSGQGMRAWARELALRGIDWLHRPFSRCLLCNRPLKPGPGPYAHLLPGYVRDGCHACWHCPACAKPYWRGGHVERMHRRLAEWARLTAARDGESRDSC